MEWLRKQWHLADDQKYCAQDRQSHSGRVWRGRLRLLWTSYQR